MIPDRSSTRRLLALIAIFSTLALIYALFGPRWFRDERPAFDPAVAREMFAKLASYNQGGGPSLRGGVGWINSGPITLAELRGKIVLLDFWTFCCINCHHVLPDLERLEEKYKNELVVIGIHTAKFEAERDTENIRRKVREYRIKHPVINDANQVLWARFGVNSWPTLALIDANGRYLGSIAGEGHYDELDRAIGRLVEQHKARGDLDLTPLKFTAEMERPSDGPLLFPGKVLADARGKRLFIADTGHNRIIQTDLEGANPVVIGTGEEGFDDGAYAKARFNRPQGLCVDGEILYVADTENHAIRAVDLKAATVATVAGTGRRSPGMQAIPFAGPARTTPLNSPWDIIQLPSGRAFYIAMAGPHQIWKLDVDADRVGVFAGSGYENILDGPPAVARFAQPSGLATDGENLFVADSEVSGLRVITGIGTGNPIVRTIVGRGLFEFGDQDGEGARVRLQHCLGLAYGDDRLYIADTYNNKVKVCAPHVREVKTLVGSHKPGDSDDPPRFYEPGGLSRAGGKLFVADTNNHKIRVIDLQATKVKTLALAGLSPPRPKPRPQSFPNATVMNAPAVEAAPGDAIALEVSIPLPKGFKLNEETPMPYRVETPDRAGLLAPEAATEGPKIKPPATHFPVPVRLAKAAAAGDSLDLRLSVLAFVCSEKSSLCQIRSFIWNVPIKFTPQGSRDPIRLTAQVK
jgi:thiol-disulfide isomerase/thioredoxin